MKTNIIVSILGARMHYAVPKILYKHNSLVKMYTDVYFGNKNFLFKYCFNNLLKINSFKKRVKTLIGRDSEIIHNSKIESFDLAGFRWWDKRRKAELLKLPEVNRTINKDFNLKIIHSIKKQSLDYNAVYGFNTASLELFEYAKKNNKICILEQTIAPKISENQILEIEIKKSGRIDKSVKITNENVMISREKKEWDLANYIIVPSKFVYDSLVTLNVEKSKIKLIPYGVDINRYKYTNHIRTNNNKKFNVLFAGHVGLRKGVHNLLEIFSKLDKNKFSLKLAGNITFEDTFINKYQTENIKFLGRVPRDEMIKLYEETDLFVFPSLCEGSATVIYESICSGVPVLTTENSGSLIENGINGYVLDFNNKENIIEIIEELQENIAKYNNLIESLKNHIELFSYSNYEKNLVNFIEDINE